MNEAGKCSVCGKSIAHTADGLCSDCQVKGALDIPAPGNRTAEAPTVVLSASIASRAAEGFSRFGDYELLEEIAHGGMGVVFKAKQISLNRIVALKMIRSERLECADNVLRFKTEAQAAAQLQHPNIVAIHEVGQSEGQHFYSMDYVEGRSLSALAREQSLSVNEAARQVKIIAEAIHYAHQRGILHRDLKPSNVLVDAANQPRITDFGLAKLLDNDSELTMTGTVMGSPSYMPPEQASGKTREVTVRSDVYSIGAILYDLVCSRPPFRAGTSLETLLQVIEMEPVSPRLLNPRIPRDLETICLKCLEKSPSKRYASAQEIADELGRFLRGEPIHARPASMAEKAWLWCKRKPAVAAAVALLAILFVGSPLAALFINQARRSAERNREIAEANLFVANMNLALAALETDNRLQALSLLKKHTPQPGQKDHRSFEWRYIWRQVRGDYAFKLGFHADAVRQVLFSSDNKLAASRSIDGTAMLWDIEAHRALFGLTNVVSIGGFSQAGSSLLVGTYDGTIQLVDTGSGARRTALTDAGILVRWLKDTNLVTTTSANYLLRVWDLSRREVRLTLPGHGGGDPGRGPEWGLRVAVNDDASTVAAIEQSATAENKQVLLLDSQSGRVLARSQPSEGAIVFLQMSPDGRFVAWGVGETVHLWDWRAQPAPMEIKAHNSAVRMISFSPDARLIATGSSDQFIKLWEVATGKLLDVRKGHENSVRALAFSSDGKWLISGGLNEAVRVWEVNGTPEIDLLEPIDGLSYRELPVAARNIAISEDSRLIAVGSATNFAQVLELSTLQPIATVSNVQKVLAFSRQGDEVLNITGEPEAIGVWNLKTHRTSLLSDSLDSLELEVACLSPDLQLAAIPAANGTLHLWDLKAGSEMTSVSGLKRSVSFLTFAHNGQMLASCSDDREVILWSAPEGRTLAVLTNHTDDVNHAAFSHDDHLLASASSDKTIRLWDTRHGSLHAVLEGHRHAVYAVSFSPDGKLLASASLDNTVKLWNLSLLQEVGRLNIVPDSEITAEKGVVMVAFSPDGNTLAARGRDGTLRVWRAASWEQIRAEATED